MTRSLSASRWKRFAAIMLPVIATSVVVGGQGAGSGRDVSPLPRSFGVLAQARDGSLLVGSGARIHQEPGLIDKVGSFLVGLGYGAPGFDSAALSVMRLTPLGALDARFGKSGAALTPLLPLRNRNSATVTTVLQDSSGRPVVVGWRYLWTATDADVLVIVAARYTAAGALDDTFGDHGVVTTRVEQAEVTQGLAAVLDREDRLVVAGYSGGRKQPDRRGSFDDWSIRTILLRYTSRGVLDASFGDRGVASQALDPSGQDRQSGRDFLLYDYKGVKTAALLLDRAGRAVVAASNGEGSALLTRYTQDGRHDPTFGNAGIVHPPVGADFSISALSWDADERLFAVGTSADRMILVRYSADGVLDSMFGTGGVSSTPIGAGMRVSSALHDGDGRLLVVASGASGVHLARFDRDGLPDKSFGSGGAIRSVPGRRIATAAGLAIDEAGVPTVAALSSDGIFLVRYTAAGPVDLSFRSTVTARP